jgi:hypothetical protein
MAPLSLVFPPSPPRSHPHPGLTPGNHRARFSTRDTSKYSPHKRIYPPLFRLVAQTANLHTMAISRRRVTCRPGTDQSTWSPPPTPGPAVWQLAKRPSGSDMPLLFLLAQNLVLYNTSMKSVHLSSSKFVRSEIALVASALLCSVVFVSPLQSSQGLNSMLPLLTCQHVNPRNYTIWLRLTILNTPTRLMWLPPHAAFGPPSDTH